MRSPTCWMKYRLTRRAISSTRGPSPRSSLTWTLRCYYVQYAHARICTLIAALAAQGHRPEDGAADASLLTTPEERELIKQLAALPEEIRQAARDYDPSRMNRYVTELATRFHKFYTVCRIKDAEEGVLEARLALCDSVRRVLEIALGIIGVSAPEKM